MITDEMNYPSWLIEDWKQTWGTKQTKEIINYFQKNPTLTFQLRVTLKKWKRWLKEKLFIIKH